MKIKIKIIYFAYLVPNVWEPIVIEQLDALYNIDLYNLASNIYMSVISDDIELEKLKTLIGSKYTKIKLVNIYNKNLYEYPGIKTILDVAQNKFNDDDNDNEDIILLYFHSKGMTSKQHVHRDMLFKYIINNYNIYLDEMKINNKITVASLLPHEAGYAFFNFFWVRASYLKKYHKEPLITDDRYYYETWVGNLETKDESIVTYSPILKYNTIKQHQQINGGNMAAEIFQNLEQNIYKLNKTLDNLYYEPFTNIINTSDNVHNEPFYEKNTNINILLILFIFILIIFYYKLNNNNNMLLIIIIIIIIFLIYNNNNNYNIDNFTNTNNKYVCLYAYYEKNDEYKNNLIFFLNHGILNNVDYYFIINGECTVDIPKLNNIKILRRENIGFDFGAWSHCIHQLNKQYEYYIFLNTSVKGPYITKEDTDNNITWLDKFLVLFNNKDIKMVGTTIIIFNLKYYNLFYSVISTYKEIYNKDNNIDIHDEYFTHIQSMFFILNNESLNYLLSQNFFDENKINSYNNIQEIIINYEIRLSQLILNNNWNIGSILDIYKNIDFRTNKNFIDNNIPLTTSTNEDFVFFKNWNNK